MQHGDSSNDSTRFQALIGRCPQQLSCLHTSALLESKTWERRNLKVFPPQKPDEALRPAEIHLSRRQIKYSKDKMWYLAKMVSPGLCLQPLYEAREEQQQQHHQHQLPLHSSLLCAQIRGLSIDQAVAQLEFNDKKGAKIMKEVLLEAQDKAVKHHHVEFKSNLYVAESFSGKGRYLKRLRYHGRGMCGVMDKVYCHYFVKLVEGPPPRTEERTGLDEARDYVQKLRDRTIIHSL
ncbi:39S ribosomal protein L22, mitochondrial [Solea senegalensis]|uniref:Large ribosomal subunit protein uL22m n=1 Tax=Solea senegalensis TaxID=28829 RepID=A0AAV6SF47_SOLSE|nr:39S ribosomal protein L22, mitochondrial [Solea senegalensis]